MQAILKPSRVWSREQVFGSDVPPRSPGIYGWWFREVPAGVPTEGCVTNGKLTLLYVGIAPGAPPTNGKPPSKATLRRRLRQHLAGNASGSTLRLTLGCLLAEQLGIRLQRVGSSGRLTFADGEARLTDWMDQNAFVSWVEVADPWVAEAAAIRSLCLPLNLSQNSCHPFHGSLSACRDAARRQARQERPPVSGDSSTGTAK